MQIEKKYYVLNVGEIINIVPDIKPSITTNTQLIWTSSNNAIATFDESGLKGISSGRVKVVCRSTDGSNLFSEVDVFVVDILAEMTFQPWVSSGKVSSENVCGFYANKGDLLCFDWMCNSSVDGSLRVLLDGAEVTCSSSSLCNGTNMMEILNSGEHTMSIMSDGSASKIDNITLYLEDLKQGKKYSDWTSTNYSDDSKSSYVYELQCNADSRLTFDWETSSERDYDELVVTLDDLEILRKSGVNVKGSYSTMVSAGYHQLVVAYIKDGSEDSGEDEVYIRNVQIQDIKADCGRIFEIPDQLSKIIVRKEVENYDVTYTRNFKNTNYQALFIPFQMSYDDWKDDFDVYTINCMAEFDEDGDEVMDVLHMYLEKVREGYTLKANYPYLIKAKTIGEKTITVHDAMLFPSKDLQSVDCSTMVMNYSFTGTYSSVTNMKDMGAYALSSGSLKLASSNSVTLSPFRWYMISTPRESQFAGKPVPKALNVKMMLLGEDEKEETNLDMVEMGAESLIYYDVNGIRSKVPHRGINLIKMSDGTIKKVYLR